jgi:hypothetical protein
MNITLQINNKQHIVSNLDEFIDQENVIEIIDNGIKQKLYIQIYHEKSKQLYIIDKLNSFISLILRKNKIFIELKYIIYQDYEDSISVMYNIGFKLINYKNGFLKLLNIIMDHYLLNFKFEFKDFKLFSPKKMNLDYFIGIYNIEYNFIIKDSLEIKDLTHSLKTTFTDINYINIKKSAKNFYPDKGHLYIVFVSEYNICKIGFSITNEHSTRNRYITPYGSTLQLLIFNTDHPLLCEKIFQKYFIEYNKSGELYDLSYIELYKTYITDITSKNIDELLIIYDKPTKIKKETKYTKFEFNTYLLNNYNIDIQHDFKNIKLLNQYTNMLSEIDDNIEPLYPNKLSFILEICNIIGIKNSFDIITIIKQDKIDLFINYWNNLTQEKKEYFINLFKIRCISKNDTLLVKQIINSCLKNWNGYQFERKVIERIQKKYDKDLKIYEYYIKPDNNPNKLILSNL